MTRNPLKQSFDKETLNARGCLPVQSNHRNTRKILGIMFYLGTFISARNENFFCHSHLSCAGSILLLVIVGKCDQLANLEILLK